MTLDSQVISAVFSGLVLVLGAVGTLIGVRGRKVAVDRRDHRKLQRRYLDALRHIFALEQDFADLGYRARDRPSSLDSDKDDDEDGPVRLDTALPPVPQPERGRHGTP